MPKKFTRKVQEEDLPIPPGTYPATFYKFVPGDPNDAEAADQFTFAVDVGGDEPAILTGFVNIRRGGAQFRAFSEAIGKRKFKAGDEICPDDFIGEDCEVKVAINRRNPHGRVIQDVYPTSDNRSRSNADPDDEGDDD